MLKFINLQTGDLYNGEKPYIHWFEEGQSVNINYCKEIVFISDKSSLSVSIEDNPYFKLMDFNADHFPVPHQYEQESLNGFDYYHIEDFLVDTLSLEGISYGGSYLYRFFVYAFSSSTGEYLVDIDIDDTTIQIGADFYPENELLTNDLENLGIEIPMQIQKAVYETNVHEEAMDNIIMNRKWKELLLSYWDIVACKGSYSSLINSMKFFEYGELMKIEEWWKVHYNKDIFISNDLEQILNDRFREQLSVLSKTTYIGLYLALNKLLQVNSGNGQHPSEQDIHPEDIFAQDNPALERISAMWGAVDLSLKMTLVGNFFSTYFMPLHLDLIHSTIENIVFTNTIKIISKGGLFQIDHVDMPGWFSSSIEDDSNYYIMPQDVYVSERTILGYKDFFYDSGTGEIGMIRNDDPTKYSEDIKFLGVDLEPNTSYVPNGETLSGYELAFLGLNCIHEFGALVPIDARIVANVSQDDKLVSAQIHWVRDGRELFDYFDNGIWISPILNEETNRYEFKFNFHLLFTNAGRYHFFITFLSDRGYQYSHEFTINVLDDTDNPIHIYKVEKVHPNKYKDLDLAVGSNYVRITNGEYSYDLNEFMFSQRYSPLSRVGTQYICADERLMKKTTGLNHIVMFTTGGNGENARIGDRHPSQWTVSSLEGAYPDYWWFSRQLYTSIDSEGGLDDNMTVITGIRKYFTIEDETTVLYKKIYKRNNAIAKVKVTQFESLVRTSVIYSDATPAQTYSVPLSDYVEFDVFGHHEKVRIYPDYNWLLLERNPLTNRVKGHVEDKIKCEGDFYQLVDEDRFIPIFHELVKINESNCEILPSELIVAIPELNRTYTDNSNIVWEFKNSSTMESITTYKGTFSEYGSGPGDDVYLNILQDTDYIDYVNALVGKFEPRPLTPGYYNINLNYKYAGIQHNESRDAAFKIRKGYEG